jgi:hypothetical protein
MVSTDAGRAASRALRRMGWLLHAYVVEIKLQALREAVKANFDPNQPRVPAGNPDGGQWTDGGGTGGRLPRGSGTLLDVGDSPSERVRLAQARRGRGGSGRIQLGNGQFAEPTPAQAARYEVIRARAKALARQVRERDPQWRPTPSFTESVEGEILALQAEAREAEVYLRELAPNGQGPGPYATESIPARGPGRNYRKHEREEINRIGRESGCHTCGNKNPGTNSGNFVADHQLPNVRNPKGRPQRLYPQCLTCSNRQGGWLRNH